MYRHQQHLIHQGASGLTDPVAARQKEEQRRRQQAYAQALAQQVQQRELQKQREREVERQGTSHGRAGQSHAPYPGSSGRLEHQQHEVAGKGFWDGLGERANTGRTNFARGQRQVQQPAGATAMATAAPQHTHTLNDYTSELRDPFEQPPRLQSIGDHAGGFVHAGYGSNAHVFAQPQQLYPMMPPPPSLATMDAAVNFSDWGAPLQQTQQQLGLRHEQQPMTHDDLFAGARAHYQQDDPIATHYEHKPPPSHHSLHPQQQLQQPPQEQVANHRGRQLNIANTGGGFRPGAATGDDESKARRKLQQQQEMQLALQQQVEEKNRQKLEAKRRQDEEDRREAARFEAEQQRARQEEDRAKELKRLKAGEELARAQQAAVALADRQKKAQQNRQQQQQQQQLHDEPSLPMPQRQLPPRPLHHQATMPQMRQHAPTRQTSPHKMDPFANTRAHLFEDPPVAASPLRQQQQQQQRWGMHSSSATPDHFDNGNYTHGVQLSQGHRAAPVRSTELRTHAPMHRSRSHAQMPPGSFEPDEPHTCGWAAPAPAVDPVVLQRQYDEMKEELMRQRQIVEQLRHAHAQIQMQQQQQSQQSLASAPSPTLLDLEQLRHELREELEHREQLHRQELEKFRAQQRQLQLVRSSLEPLCAQVTRSMVSASGSSSGQHLPDPRSTADHRVERSLECGLSSSRISALRASASQELELGSTSTHAVVSPGSIVEVRPTSLAALQCDSKLVYFDGRVHQHHEPQQPESSDSTDGDRASPSASRTKRPEPIPCVSELLINLDDSVDARVSQSSTRQSIDAATKTRASVRTSRSASLPAPTNNQTSESSAFSSTRKKQHRHRAPAPALDNGSDDDDAREFFVKDLRSSVALECEASGSLFISHTQRNSAGANRGGASARYASWSETHRESDDSGSWDLATLRASTQRWLHLVEHDEDDDDDGDDNDAADGGLRASANLKGEELEAIFHRNVRRHEILLGFQPTKPRGATTSTAMSRSNQSELGGSQRGTVRTAAWSELHQQLEANANDTRVSVHSSSETAARAKAHNRAREGSLVASSRWMHSVT